MKDLVLKGPSRSGVVVPRRLRSGSRVQQEESRDEAADELRKPAGQGQVESSRGRGKQGGSVAPVRSILLQAARYLRSRIIDWALCKYEIHGQAGKQAGIERVGVCREQPAQDRWVVPVYGVRLMVRGVRGTNKWCMDISGPRTSMPARTRWV